MPAILRLFSLVAFAGVPFALASCIDQISADLPAPPKVLVINSILTPDSLFRVQVSRVTSTVDSSSRLLSTANVYLLAPGRGAELLRNQGRGSYASPNKPVSGVPYTLRAEVDGYPTISATDTVPMAVPIREAWHSYPTGTDRNNELLGTIVVRFDDPGQTANFYEITAHQSQDRGLGQSPRQSQDFALDARGNAAMAAEGDAEFEPASLVFSDKLFNGQPFELRASFSPFSRIGGGIANGQPVGPRVSGEVYVVLRSVSRAYYQYRKSWTRHFYNQGTKGLGGGLTQLLFLGDPTRMYSNVAQGYGVVVSQAQEIKRLPAR
ncbi:DUF4249 domain-containing protein [Hymenobacter lapidiphilus]|uniref:DUF4249 domain-containing protein n=1 Tax=Hymenobacter lapidiphilus TaxID=2608003 RepID=A0A7Y7U6Y8_9BACT|nr:DUF4249 domain-containing protein [Hymenobacter lapidiphilus]NVO32892.1 DUF4249 domain-containing protein [Hymenobacter lapidiphilus]